jgi:hypothetical protein
VNLMVQHENRRLWRRLTVDLPTKFLV